MMNWIWAGNGIDEEGAEMVCEALKCNSTFTKLDLGGDKTWDNIFNE